MDTFADFFFGAVKIVLGIIFVPIGVAVIVSVVRGLVLRAREDAAKARVDARKNHQDWIYKKSVRELVEQGPGASWSFSLPLNGREIIIPHKLQVGQVYQIEFTGSYSEKYERADAFYRADRLGNFTHEFRKGFGLQIQRESKSKWLAHRIVVHEVHNHKYVVEIDGTGDFLSLAFIVDWEEMLPSACLKVEITQAPASVPTLASERAQERAEEQVALVLRDASNLASKRAALKLLSEPLKNWGDESFRTIHANRRTKTLLRDGQSIIRSYLDLHGRDPELIASVRSEDPATYARLTGKFQAFLLAERVDLERDGKRPTTKEVRERIVRRFNVTAADELAIIDAAIAARDTKSQMLLEAGLDEDQVEDVLGPVSESVEEALDKQQKRGNGKEQNDATLALG